MESRESVLEAVKRQPCKALQEADEVWRSDHEVVLTAVQREGRALQFVAEALKGDREIVLAAVRQAGWALKYATEALRTDREIVLAAVQQDAAALLFAADAFLEDPSFATEAKRQFHLLKVTMLSGRSTVVAAWLWNVPTVLQVCRRRLGLADDGTTMELWYGAAKVPSEMHVRNWPGIKPRGEISEYQLVVMP
eukprot:744392-Amphidinium_carterae.1